MKKFIKHICIFILIIVIIGELIIRVNHVTIDIPQRTIDDFGVQKYFPNQEGYWKGGNHNWTINEFGWPGELPTSYDNLIMIIGDSYIENFMNPNECHQSYFLKKEMIDYNFMEASRSGVSLIEAMEISRQTDTLNPIHSLIYVNDNDFYESIYQVKPLNDITQLDLDNKSIVSGKIKSPRLKKILYSWKLLLYLYTRFSLENNTVEEPMIHEDEIEEINENSETIDHQNKILKLIEYINTKYIIENKTLVFHPDSNFSIVEMCRKAGFNTIVLDSSNDLDWSFVYDSHWTCYGHKRVAEQVSKSLLLNSNINSN